MGQNVQTALQHALFLETRFNLSNMIIYLSNLKFKQNNILKYNFFYFVQNINKKN